MKIFVTGASGYIGGSVAAALAADGHQVRGLVRDPAKAAGVKAFGIEPVIGTLDDADVLTREARAADAVINAASSDHRPAADALIAALAGSGKTLIHTSGSGIAADQAMGEPSEAIFTEAVYVPGSGFSPDGGRAKRVELDKAILAAPGVRSVVLCCTLIYGHTLGPPAQSVQLPRLVDDARASGVPHYIGRGLNRWSNVHITDTVDLYRLALDRAPAASFAFVESGEASFGDMAQALSAALGLPPAQSIGIEAAAELWGRGMSAGALASNSRVRGTLGRQLGWAPKHDSVLRWIAEDLVTA